MTGQSNIDLNFLWRLFFVWIYLVSASNGQSTYQNYWLVDNFRSGWQSLFLDAFCKWHSSILKKRFRWKNIYLAFSRISHYKICFKCIKNAITCGLLGRYAIFVEYQLVRIVTFWSLPFITLFPQKTSINPLTMMLSPWWKHESCTFDEFLSKTKIT